MQKRRCDSGSKFLFHKAIADADAIGVEIGREQKLMALEKRVIENVAESERSRETAGCYSPPLRSCFEPRCCRNVARFGDSGWLDAANDHSIAR